MWGVAWESSGKCWCLLEIHPRLSPECWVKVLRAYLCLGAWIHSFCFSPSPGFSPGNCQKRQRSVLCTGAKKLVVLFVPIINKWWQTHLPPGGALVWTEVCQEQETLWTIKFIDFSHIFFLVLFTRWKPSYLITESQNCRGWKRPLEVKSSPLLKQALCWTVSSGPLFCLNWEAQNWIWDSGYGLTRTE